MYPFRSLVSLAAALWFSGSPLFAAPEEGSEVSSGDRNSETTFVLWNVRNFGVSDHFIAGQRREAIMKPASELQAMVAILKRLDPDVVAFNEIISAPDDRYLHALQALLKRHGLDYPHLATVQGDDPRIQNALLSRLPLSDVRQLDTESFNLQRHSASTGASMPVTLRPLRGFLSATVTLPGPQPIGLVVAHLKSKASATEFNGQDPSLPGDEVLRLEETKLLLAALDRVREEAPTRPLILLGDLNDTPNSKTLRHIRAWSHADEPDHPLLVDLELTDYLGDRWTHFYYPEKAYNVLDYIWVSSALLPQIDRTKSFVYREKDGEPSRYQTMSASDHRPLVLTIKDQNKVPKDQAASANKP